MAGAFLLTSMRAGVVVSAMGAGSLVGVAVVCGV